MAGMPVEAPAIPTAATVKKKEVTAAVDADAETTEETEVAKEVDEEIEVVVEKKLQAFRKKYGTDVTSDFPNAMLLQVAVFQNKKTKQYTVLDIEEDGMVLKTSKSKVNVEKFLAKQMD